MSDKRKLDFKSEADVVDDVSRLRAGHTKVGGTWTFEQTCSHMAIPLVGTLEMPASLDLTPEQRQMHGRLDGILAARAMPDNAPLPPGVPMPPPDAGPEAIDGLIAALSALTAYENTHVTFGPFGPTPVGKFREFVLIHSAHHLNFFKPLA